MGVDHYFCKLLYSYIVINQLSTGHNKHVCSISTPQTRILKQSNTNITATTHTIYFLVSQSSTRKTHSFSAISVILMSHSVLYIYKNNEIAACHVYIGQYNKCVNMIPELSKTPKSMSPYLIVIFLFAYCSSPSIYHVLHGI